MYNTKDRIAQTNTELPDLNIDLSKLNNVHSMKERATETNLNKEEFEQLKEAYVSTIVDSMSMKDLVDYVKTDYYNSLDKYNEFDLFEDIKYTLEEDFLDEMLLTIKQNRRG